MNDPKLSMARLALSQLNRKDRLALARELGLMADEQKTFSPIEARLLRRGEVARRLAVSVRTVDNWAQQGLLTKRILPGRRRACGFPSSEIDQLILQGITRG